MLQADLERIRSLLLQRSGALVNLTGDERALSGAQAHVGDLLSALPATSSSPTNWSGTLPSVNEALVVPTQVSRGVASPAPSAMCLSRVRQKHMYRQRQLV